MHLPRRDVILLALNPARALVAEQLAAVGDHHANAAGVAGD
jgi:hypothetical protein